jgi:phospholipase C
MNRLFSQALVLVGALAAAACSGAWQLSSPQIPHAAQFTDPAQTGAAKIQHVVYIIQENRSFNNLFQGYPGAYTVSRGKNSKGQIVMLKPVSLAYQYEIDHSSNAMFEACHSHKGLPGTHCRMDAFDKEWSSNRIRSLKYPQYVYVPHTESRPYFDMAHEWVLADQMFASQLDESFVAHQYVIAAQAQASVDLPYGPWGCPRGPSDTVNTMTKGRYYGPPEVPCFNYETLGDELDTAGLSWRFYSSWYGQRSSGFGAVWSGFQAVKHIYEGPDWANVITPQKKFLTDVERGKLANFTWITPVCHDSDHPNCGGGYGPSWVTALVNQVGASKFWKTTAIFVQWDDWGGLYDPVPPPYADYDGLGFRVPLLVISPYAKANYVSHVPYETASVLRFAEDLWGLGRLAAADARAASPAADCFDFTQKPRKFVPIKAPKGLGFFLTQSDDFRIPDGQ